YIPAKLAYGDVPKGPIPAGSALQFDVTLVDFKPQPAPDMNSIQISPDVLKSLGAGAGAPAPAPSGK
ncbi:MAG TPA: hypothetical protein VHC95_02500, partial [Opitutales bacterium]|nr:hypothetical protein [Opitutales bacterium]